MDRSSFSGSVHFCLWVSSKFWLEITKLVCSDELALTRVNPGL